MVRDQIKVRSAPIAKRILIPNVEICGNEILKFRWHCPLNLFCFSFTLFFAQPANLSRHVEPLPAAEFYEVAPLRGGTRLDLMLMCPSGRREIQNHLFFPKQKQNVRTCSKLDIKSKPLITLADCYIARPTDKKIYTDRQTDRLNDRLNDRLTDWQTDRLTINGQTINPRLLKEQLCKIRQQ